MVCEHKVKNRGEAPVELSEGIALSNWNLNDKEIECTHRANKSFRIARLAINSGLFCYVPVDAPNDIVVEEIANDVVQYSRRLKGGRSWHPWSIGNDQQNRLETNSKGSNMATLVNFRGLSVVSPPPTGDGGLAIQNDLENLVQWSPKSSWNNSTSPAVTDSSAFDFYPGSLWSRTDTSPPQLFLCTNATPGAAVWSPILIGNQTVALTGNVTGSGTTSIVTTIGAGVVTNAMLAGSIAASKLVGTDIATVGNVTSGTWSATKIGLAFGGTNLDSSNVANGTLLIGNGSGFTLAPLTGTANQVNVINAAGAVTLTLPQSIATSNSPQFQGLGIGIAADPAIGIYVKSTKTAEQFGGLHHRDLEAQRKRPQRRRWCARSPTIDLIPRLDFLPLFPSVPFVQKEFENGESLWMAWKTCRLNFM